MAAVTVTAPGTQQAPYLGSAVTPVAVTGTSLGVGNHTLVTGGLANRFVLFITAAAGAATLTIKAGVEPPAMRATSGDLAITISGSGNFWAGPFESGRFLQADGTTINLAVATQALTVYALQTPGAT